MRRASIAVEPGARVGRVGRAPVEGPMTPEQRGRAEFVARASSALRYLREVELSADHRARDLEELRGRLGDPRGLAGAFLVAMVRGLDAVAAAARGALGHVEGVSVAEMAEGLEGGEQGGGDR